MGMVAATVADLIQLAIRKGKADKRNVIPLGSDEIVELERDVRAVLPLRYREFLELAGRGFGIIGVDSDMFYPGILGLRVDVAEMLTENNVIGEFGDGDIPFYMYQGYDAAWLRGPGDDPPVYRFIEGGRGVYRDADSFTDWLRCYIEARV